MKKQFNHLINHESGLLGISETSSDMHDLLALEKEDIRAAEAISLVCYQTKKWIGAYTAALGGLETLVFAGGIGENAPGISAKRGKAVVRVIHTDEEGMIAKTVSKMISII